jgi:hypothetical protein
MLATIVPLLLLAAAPSADDREAIELRIVRIYAPYSDGANTVPAWEHPIYSAEVAALIARWKAVMPEGELDGLNDGDWLCQCQEYDAGAFQATIVSIAMNDDGSAEVEMRLDLGYGGPESLRPARFTLVREEGEWRIAEIVAESFANGLRQALRETIAQDEALAAGEAG